MYNLEQGYENVSVAVRERLLRRCSRFDMSCDSDSAGQAVTKLGERVKQKKEAVLEQIRTEYFRSYHFGTRSDFVSRLRRVADAFPLIKSLVADLPGAQQAPGTFSPHGSWSQARSLRPPPQGSWSPRPPLWTCGWSVGFLC